MCERQSVLQLLLRATDSLNLPLHVFDMAVMLNDIYGSTHQLISVTCLFIAAKYEEVDPPPLSDFCRLIKTTRSSIVNAEASILQVLNFRLHMPLPYTCLREEMGSARMSKHKRDWCVLLTRGLHLTPWTACSARKVQHAVRRIVDGDRPFVEAIAHRIARARRGRLGCFFMLKRHRLRSFK